MDEKIKKFKENLLHRMDELINEIEKDKSRYCKEYEKIFYKKNGYVLKENLATYDEEIEAINDAKKMIENINIEKIESINECRMIILKHLEMMYNKVTRLRAGIKIIIECMKQMSELENFFQEKKD